MANSTVTFKEMRFTGLDGELTHCFVFCEAGGDSPIGVQGWHHKAFPPSMNCLQILKAWEDGKEDPVLWPLCAPGNE